MRRYLSAVLLFAVASPVLAQTTVPHTFTSGTTAKASEVNANFTALVDAISALQAKVAVLEGGLTVATVAGEYRLLKYGQFYFPSSDGQGAIYCHGAGGGSTVTLNANGTFNMTYQELEVCGGSVGGHRPQPIEAPDTVSGTWQLVGNSISLDFGDPDDDDAVFQHGSGGRFFVEVVAQDRTFQDAGDTVTARDFQFLALVRK